MKIAIIGGGPRGLWAAEELGEAARAHNVDLHVDVFEQGNLGEGSAYRVDQPAYWRINVPSHVITSKMASFDQWRLDQGEQAPLESFPARAKVGQFFAEAWEHCIRMFPEDSKLNAVHKRVESLVAVEDGWLVEGSFYHEVLLATGHTPTWEGTLRRGDCVTGVYPREQLDRVPAGEAVAVRGMALTFIDAALELTIGRGGRIEDGKYVPSGREPSVIIPTSRSGRFMEVKPAPNSALAALDLDEVIAAGQAAIRLSADLPELEKVLADTAFRILERAGGTPLMDTIWAVLNGTDGSGDPVADLRRSRDVAVGAAAPTPQWAAGEAWRRLYPAIVWRTSFRDPMPGFTGLARIMERVGFGPPSINVDILLALMDAGLINPGADPTTAKMLIDATLTPPGVIPGTILHNLNPRRTGRGATVNPDATVPGLPHLAVVGRDTEDGLLGPDTLSRTLHDVIPRWAQTIINRFVHNKIQEPGMHATVPLTARLEPWSVDLINNPAQCDALLEQYGSPVNVLYSPLMERNINELVRAGWDMGVDTRVFFARKANKALTFVDTVRDNGHGVDVASERELKQVLDRGMPGERIILSAAVKPDSLLSLAITNGVAISVDSVGELERVEKLASVHKQNARVAPRLAPDPDVLPPTRFGERLDVWRGCLGEGRASISIVGVHVHLHGYAAADRRSALMEAFTLADDHPATEFIDLGGGVPMSYLDDADEWAAFHEALGEGPDFTWKGDPLKNVYPFHQSPTRGEWLKDVLREPIAEEFISRGLRLHLEPGRSILDGCGVILARVAFLKTRSDGLPLVGLEMNRTQCRTTSDDILLDPLLVRTGGEGGWDPGSEGYLVGAYCIEDEVIVRRRMRFPNGIAPGDIVAIPNTAGYFMHILESASHQIPLAKNVVLIGGEGGSAGQVLMDDIDA